MENRIIVSLVMLIMALIGKSEKYPFNIEGKEATSVGVYISDINTNEVLYNHNAEMSFLPASIMKAVTTASVLSEKGSDYKFKTDVYAVGNISDSTFTGNIIVDGVGDPTIDSRHFPKNCNFVDNIATSLKKLGVNYLNANIILNTNVKEEGVIPHWQIEDVAWGYGAGLYGFNYQDNTFNYYINQDSIFPLLKGIKICNNTTYGKDDPIMVRGIGSNEITITGSVPDRDSYFIECAVPCPEKVFEGDIFSMFDCNLSDSNLLKSEDVDTIKLYTHTSPRLKNIMRSLMVRSDNLFAEGILRLLANDRSRTNALVIENKLWQSRGIDTKYVSIQDGSGLSRMNKLTPKFLSDVMQWMANSRYCDDYVYLFPRAGKDGTMKNFLKGTRLAGKIALKTGSMRGVQTYAGYKLDANGKPTHTVVVMINSFFCERYQLRKEVERLLLQIF